MSHFQLDSAACKSLKMNRKRKYSDLDDSDETTENETDLEDSDETEPEDSTSESEVDNSDTDNETEDASDPWLPIREAAFERNMTEYETLIENFSDEGLGEEEAKSKAYVHILPKLRKDLQNVYLERLLWIQQLKRDPVHKEVMETRDRFINEDGFDSKEAIEAAIDKRKFLLKRLFRNKLQSRDVNESDS